MKKHGVRLRMVLSFCITICCSFNVFGTTYYSRASGNWNSNTTWSTTGFGGAAAGAGAYPGSAAGDIAIISRRTVTVTATPANPVTSVTLDQSSGSTNLTKLLLNVNGTTLTTGSLTMSDNNLNADVELEISGSARLDVTGAVSVTRSSNSSQATRMRVYLLNTAVMTVGTTFTYNYFRCNLGDTETEVLLANTSQLLITGAFTLNYGHANMESDNPFDFVMTETPTFSSAAFNVIGSSFDQSMDNINITMAGGNFTCTAFDVDLSNSNGGECDLTLDMNGGTFICTSFSSDIADITAGEDVSAYYNFNGGTFTCNGSANLSVAATSLGISNNKINVDGGAVSITGSLTCTQAGGTTGDIYIYINQNTTASVSSFSVGTNMDVTHTGGDDFRIRVNQTTGVSIGTFTVGGTLTINHTGGDNVLFYGYKNSVINLGSYTADFTSDDGDLLTHNFYLSDVNINGGISITNNAGIPGNTAETVLMDINGSTFDVIGDITLTQATGENDKSDDIQWKMSRDAGTGIVSTVNVGGNFTLNGTAGNDVYITADYNSIITITGQLYLNQDGGDAMYCNIGSTAGSPTFTVGSLNMDYSGGTSNTLTLSSSSVFQSNGDVTLVATAQAKTVININSTSNFKIKGSFIRSAAPNRFGDVNCASTATITYNGATASQTIAGDVGQGTDAFTYGNVTIVNTFGTIPQLLMTAAEGNATIPSGSTLTFTTGVVSSLSTAMFVVASGASANGGDVDSYNDGPMKKIGTTSFIYPLGNGSVWARLGQGALTNGAATTEFIAQYYYASAPNPTNIGATIDYPSKVEYWDLSRNFDVGNDASCQVTLYWEDNTRSGIDITGPGLADLTVGHYSGLTSLWEDQGGAAAGGATGQITSSVALVNFSPVTISSKTSVSPLPVKWGDFELKKQEKSVDLNWITLSEINTSHFDIERASATGEFIKVGMVKASGNSTAPINYAFTDHKPIAGGSLYRLKQFDIDGKFDYSIVRNVNFEGPAKLLNAALNVYPNPVDIHTHFNISFSGFDGEEVLVVLQDVTGKVIAQRIVVNIDGQTLSSTELTSHIPAGIYIVVASSDDHMINKKLIVR